MHIYISGIGGTGMGPLAELALDAGYSVSGSDGRENSMTRELADRGIDIVYEQTEESIAAEHLTNPIDWFIYTSALSDDHPELKFAREHGIRVSKRGEFLSEFIRNHNLSLIAIAGTHGKTTTTGMFIWAAGKLGLPISYSVGSTLPFGPSAKFDPRSKYFIYEADEYDRNFLNFYPDIAVFPSIEYDHPDIFPTVDDYKQAFRDFINQSKFNIMFERDHQFLQPLANADTEVFEHQATRAEIDLPGQTNRNNAYLVAQTLSTIDNYPVTKLHQVLSSFAGAGRRFEKLAPNLYSDYAHHPSEIKATIDMARELNPNVVVVYQPHQNIRQYEVRDGYKDAFAGVKKIYWLPTYLAREDGRPVLTPKNLIAKLADKDLAEPAEMNEELSNFIQSHIAAGELVIIMGAGPVDDWARNML
ncbi:MAG: Mur ligase domain-containing protein [Candidatus Nomurabacteria bacterium]|jgi:UDP-N-acetylmuramate--alanine ligase|nr:Mur ligase domain-containing protein [Candidatus Nomurabacteria bacterium]